MDIFTAVAGC